MVSQVSSIPYVFIFCDRLYTQHMSCPKCALMFPVTGKSTSNISRLYKLWSIKAELSMSALRCIIEIINFNTPIQHIKLFAFLSLRGVCVGVCVELEASHFLVCCAVVAVYRVQSQ